MSFKYSHQVSSLPGGKLHRLRTDILWSSTPHPRMSKKFFSKEKGENTKCCHWNKNWSAHRLPTRVHEVCHWWPWAARGWVGGARPRWGLRARLPRGLAGAKAGAPCGALCGPRASHTAMGSTMRPMTVMGSTMASMTGTVNNPRSTRASGVGRRSPPGRGRRRGSGGSRSGRSRSRTRPRTPEVPRAVAGRAAGGGATGGVAAWGGRAAGGAVAAATAAASGAAASDAGGAGGARCGRGGGGGSRAAGGAGRRGRKRGRPRAGLVGLARRGLRLGWWVRPSLWSAGPAQVSFPAILLYHVRQLDDVLALLVLLARLERQLIFPAERRLAALAVDVGDGVQPGEEHSLLGWATPHVHYRVK